jgi:hypothetical protein
MRMPSPMLFPGSDQSRRMARGHFHWSRAPLRYSDSALSVPGPGWCSSCTKGVFARTLLSAAPEHEIKSMPDFRPARDGSRLLSVGTSMAHGGAVMRQRSGERMLVGYTRAGSVADAVGINADSAVLGYSAEIELGTASAPLIDSVVVSQP